MTYLNRHFTESFRGAAHEEVMHGEEQFMADMADVLTEEAIAEGVQINFGSNKVRFEQVLDILHIDAFVKHDKLEVVESFVGNSTGRKFISIDVADRAASQHGLLNALDYIQSEEWVTHDAFASHLQVTAGLSDTLTSQMTLGNSFVAPDRDGERYLMPDAPVVIVTNTTRYSPTSMDEYGNEDNLAHYVSTYENGGNHPQRLFQKLLEDNVNNGQELLFPTQTYTLGIAGKNKIVEDVFISQVEPTIKHFYIVDKDRIVPYVDPYLEADDSQEAY